MSIRRVSFAFGVPVLWAMGCIAILAMAAMTFTAVSVITANAGFFAKGRVLQDTYFVVPHFHYVIWRAGALFAVFGAFAGWYHFFPKITGYSYSERLGRIHFWLSIAGVGALNLTDIILSARVFLFLDADMLRYWNRVAPTGAYVFAASLLTFFANMILSFVRRQPAR